IRTHSRAAARSRVPGLPLSAEFSPKAMDSLPNPATELITTWTSLSNRLGHHFEQSTVATITSTDSKTPFLRLRTFSHSAFGIHAPRHPRTLHPIAPWASTPTSC